MRELLKFFFKSASSLKQFIFVGFNMRTYKQRFGGILDELMDIAYAVFLTRVGWIWQPLIHIRVPVPASQGAMSGQIIFMHKMGILASRNFSTALAVTCKKKGWVASILYKIPIGFVDPSLF